MMAVRKGPALAGAELPSESPGLWLSVVESVPDLLLLVDREGRILYMNRLPPGVVGEQVSGTSVFDFVPLESGPELRKSLGQIFTGGGARARVLPGRHPDGSIRWYAIHTGPVNHDGRVIAATIIARDVTRQRLLEEHVQQKQKLEALGQLSGGIAHDFNNILAVISASAELLLDGLSLSPESSEDVAALRDAIRRGGSLTQQLLSFARPHPAQPERLDLNAVVKDEAAMLAPLLGSKHTLILCLDPSGAPVRCDRTQLEQVLMNLVLNACDAMADGGGITITTRRLQEPKGPCVRLRVEDTGVGMDEATQRRAFEPFFTTKPPGKGTGLGLSTVYMIVKQAGGSVQVESRVGAGSTFDVALPDDELQRS
jgi:PAS domain S-box-containing protein